MKYVTPLHLILLSMHQNCNFISYTHRFIIWLLPMVFISVKITHFLKEINVLLILVPYLVK